jgi:hypothetical protein
MKYETPSVSILATASTAIQGNGSKLEASAPDAHPTIQNPMSTGKLYDFDE